MQCNTQQVNFRPVLFPVSALSIRTLAQLGKFLTDGLRARLAPYGACDTISSICINSDAVSLKLCPLGLEAALLLDTQRSLLCVLHTFAFSSLYYCRWLLSVGQSQRPLISSLSTTGGKRLRRSIRGSACCGTALPPQRRVPWWPSSHST